MAPRSNRPRAETPPHSALSRLSLLRGSIVSVGGILFMFCCLMILTVSSCNLGR